MNKFIMIAVGYFISQKAPTWLSSCGLRERSNKHCLQLHCLLQKEVATGRKPDAVKGKRLFLFSSKTL